MVLKKCVMIFLGICIFIWVWCKVLGFRIVPSSMIVPAPKKFQLPKIRKNAEGEWISEELEESEDDSDSSEESSEDESSEDEYSSSDDFY